MNDLTVITKETCPCMCASFVAGSSDECWSAREERLLHDFQTIWTDCPALRKMLVPNWEEFAEADRRLRGDETEHRSMLLLAFERGHLHQITSPIHRYLMEGQAVKSYLTNQYRQDLRERWVLKNEGISRHQRSKSFVGKLIELQCAEWIEAQGWQMSDLAALGAAADIEALSPDGDKVGFEVKYIGQEDWDFTDDVESMARGGVGKGRAVHVTTAPNFLLFKAYTAARQLLLYPGHHIVLVAIDDYSAWPRFRFTLENDFINWPFPRFLEAGKEWNDFLESQKSWYPTIGKDLSQVLLTIQELWVVKKEAGFRYCLEYIFKPGSEPR